MRKWTEEQQHAINSSGGAILVSAAAGAGKTSVLTERVIKKITAPENPVDIDKFLIVTFTKTAAQEMRTRISERLSQLIMQNPLDKNLIRQKMLLKTAYIGTIDSFCSNLVKENFFKLNISPKFRIANENEISSIAENAMDKTLCEFFKSDNPTNKIAADLFTNEKNDSNLATIIDKIYEFMLSVPFPEMWVEDKLKIYDSNENEDSVWEQFILEHTKSTCEELLSILRPMKEIAASDEVLGKAYSHTLENDVALIDTILKTLSNGDFNETAQVFMSLNFSRAGSVKSKNPPYQKEIITNCRKYIKDSMSKLAKFYCFDKQSTKNDLITIKNIMSCIFDAVKYYSNEIQAVKSRKNILEFSDLEHKTLELLTDTSSGEIRQSDFAKELSAKFCEVMVDEYQDVNELQNTIFNMISDNGKNIFMVGDVKQSIYKFRQSHPEIFLNKKSLFSPYSPLNPSFPAKILLGKNFRSHPKLIDGINFIFEKLMSKNAGEIDYNSEEKLISGANYSQNSGKEIEIRLIDIQDCDESSHEIEAREIAKTIAEIVSQGYSIESNGVTRAAEFSDFCILMRNFNKQAHIYSNILQECGIPVWAETTEKFLETQEISTILAFLQTINNPTLDVPLVATLTSPFFGFTMDKIAQIRSCDKTVPFYFALKKFAEENTEDADVISFLENMDFYRTLSATTSCDELINMIYEKTDYPSICLAAEDGYRKKANLIKFEEYAADFDSEHHSGLSGFLNFIDQVKRSGKDLKSAESSSAAEHTVKIMSIHKSKGLEFPICIIANCESEFKPERESILINSELGFGMKLKNNDGTIKLDNLIRKAISLKNKQENISEEMRILYVALTRAKQKLILSATCKNPNKKISEIFSLTSELHYVPPCVVQNSSSFLNWILLALSQSNLHDLICDKMSIPYEYKNSNYSQVLDWGFEIVTPEPQSDPNNEEIPPHDFSDAPRNIDTNLIEVFEKRFNFEYPHKNCINLPMKISASQMSHGETSEEYIASSKPEFMSAKNLTPLHRGTAMHQFVCYADFKNLTSDSVESQAKNLLNSGFLTPEEFKSLDIKAIKKFTQSDIFKRISNSSAILKEHRFSAQIPACLITNGGKENAIIIQGALDCAFMENGKYVIIDYKTDKTHNMCELYEKYKRQLEIYKYALECTLNIKVAELGIYSFHLNDYFSVATD